MTWHPWFSAALVLLTLAPQVGWATAYSNPGPFVRGGAGGALPSPAEVPGKELSTFPDRDAAGALDPEQLIAWDGFSAKPGGAGVTDAEDYTGTQFFDPPNDQIDAIANHLDHLFNPLLRDKTYLIFSVGNGTAPTGNGTMLTSEGETIGRAGDLSFEAPGNPSKGVWANGATDIDTMNPPVDVDSVELWGNEPPNFDTTRFSLVNDDENAEISVYCLPCSLDPYFAHDAVVAAAEFLLGPRPDGVEEVDIDLDAMMIRDPGGIDSIAGHAGDAIIYSIRQIADPSDPDGYYATGSEIFVHLQGEGGTSTRVFLFHGGHRWDHEWTLENMKESESNRQLDVNALEAASVPEPSTAALFCFALPGLLWCAGRRRGVR